MKRFLNTILELFSRIAPMNTMQPWPREVPLSLGRGVGVRGNLPFRFMGRVIRRRDANSHSQHPRPEHPECFCGLSFGFRISDFGFRSAAASALLVLLSFPVDAENVNSVVNSKHNLSISGPGEIKAANEADICVFCHTPHTTRSEGPLWNHQMSATAYTPYSSSSMKAAVGQPTGSSKLCLSCHDGTVALGMLDNRRTPVPMTKGTTVMPAGPSKMGTDLSGHHPISFTYDSALATQQGELQDPMTLKREVRLDKNREVQCTSCHDPHNNQYGNFLVLNNSGSMLCLQCHAPKQWLNSSHATSKATWNGTGRNPWPHTTGKTVAANGCENCHAPHAAGTKPHLLNFAKAEDTCLVCHNGSVAAKNVAAEFNKASGHGTTSFAALHDSTLGPMKAADQQISCVDCHNPHGASTASWATRATSGTVPQLAGVNAAGGIVPNATTEYELCFRCHAGSAALANSKISRQFNQPNTRLQFNPGNVSYHPVIAAARKVRSPSLLSTWTAPRVRCTDCHNNDQGPGARGPGPNGPHGSRYAPLLEYNLVQTDYQAESANAYALCYKCHSRASILGDESFKATDSRGQARGHRFHIVDQRTACTTCHDSHGVQQNKNLINFNRAYVQPSSKGQLQYTSLGGGNASCSLSCHGKDHDGNMAARPANVRAPIRAAGVPIRTAAPVRP
jgi:predicted CXXCH cytochrome family protein